MTGDDAGALSTAADLAPDDRRLLADLLDGDHRALARVISKVEDRAPGYRSLVSALYDHTGHAEVIGITGSPGAGKSTLVDKLAETYRDQGLTVGIVAVDPSSPFTGGAVLGDRVRMASTVGDMDVFVRSMSARGTLGGISTATADAVKALDAFGKDRILVETVGAGQNEIDIVRTADTVAVLVPPESGDSVQMLKAGILEIGDVFVVNKADMDGADRTVQELTEMIQLGQGRSARGGRGHGRTGHDGHGHAGHDGHGHAGHADHGHHAGGHDSTHGDGEAADVPDEWVPRVVETVATDGTGVDDLLAAFADHRAYLRESGAATDRARERVAEEVRQLLREDASHLAERELDRHGGIDSVVDRILAGETDPYSVADSVLAPLEACVERDADDDAEE